MRRCSNLSSELREGRVWSLSAKGMETKAELREERNHVAKSLESQEEENEEDSLQRRPGA